jgi:anthranilate phosphoribosyltransferase
VNDDVPRFSDIFDQIVSKNGITPRSLRRVFDAILAGELTAAQVAGLVVALRLKGESAELIAAAAEALRSAMVAVEHDFDTLLDTCGTGGDGSGTLNLSTGAAIIAAAAGIPVAKHGNRAQSSRTGSADVLEALGIPIDLPATAAAEILREAKITFMMATVHHPAMRHAGPARRELGIRTIFNCLGPLANPARATHQLLGAYDDALRPRLAETLRALGTRRAWVVHGTDGLDEVSPCAPTRVSEVAPGSIVELQIAPEDFGLPRCSRADIAGADAAANARAFEQVLSGEPHPGRGAFVLNAAAALVVGLGIEPRAAAERAEQALASGAARETLGRWREAARRRRPEKAPG